MSPLLEVTDLVVRYGAVEAVKGISFTVGEGEVVTLVGSNGAGKTTTLRAISGLVPVAGGSITFDGASLAGTPAHKLAAMGIGHSPEGRHVFARMSVEENLLLGAFSRGRGADPASDLQRVFEMFPILGERRRQAAGLFSGGEQQMLAMGRALMSRPRLLMLDEPSMGLSPIMTTTIMDTIVDLRRTGTTVLLVEQNALAALSLADHGYVLEVGAVAMSGTGADLLHDDGVRRTYLGED